MKKKITSIVITASLLASITAGLGITSSAWLGSGAAVVACDVNMIKTGLVGQKICFSDSDFKSALCITDFDTVTITSIPSSTEGTLVLGGRRVGEGKVIKRKNIGSLVFMPASDSVAECRFKFKIDGAGSGEEIECILKFVDKVNYAPKAESENAAVKTQAEVPVYAALTASDPEGDALTYIVVSYPEYGTVTLARDSGKYCYTPQNGYTGTDQFTYVVRDEYGNYSYPVTVSIKVRERMCDAIYIDMTEREEYNAAIAMTAMSVMSGSIVGDDLYFSPDGEVTRAEFVAMLMKCAGIRPDTTLTATYFDDNGDIPVSLVSYVATAQRIGLIGGDFEGGKLKFSPNEAITRYEAAKIMATLLNTDPDGEETVYSTDEAVPVWARAGVYAMHSLGIFTDKENDSATATVTRADAASYFYKLIDLI